MKFSDRLAVRPASTCRAKIARAASRCDAWSMVESSDEPSRGRRPLRCLWQGLLLLLLLLWPWLGCLHARRRLRTPGR